MQQPASRWEQQQRQLLPAVPPPERPRPAADPPAPVPPAAAEPPPRYGKWEWWVNLDPFKLYPSPFASAKFPTGGWPIHLMHLVLPSPWEPQQPGACSAYQARLLPGSACRACSAGPMRVLHLAWCTLRSSFPPALGMQRTSAIAQRAPSPAPTVLPPAALFPAAVLGRVDTPSQGLKVNVPAKSSKGAGKRLVALFCRKAKTNSGEARCGPGDAGSAVYARCGALCCQRSVTVAPPGACAPCNACA